MKTCSKVSWNETQICYKEMIIGGACVLHQLKFSKEKDNFGINTIEMDITYSIELD